MVQAVSPCLARYTTGSVSLMARSGAAADCRRSFIHLVE
jgi:hypothetical protein